MTEQRFLLTIGYQAGPDPRIQRGADGYRDYFAPEDLEKAAWSLLRSGSPRCGLFHLDGTEGAAEIVESSIRREPEPWVLKAVDGTTVSVNPGDWLVGLLLDPTAWDLYKSGKIAGVSPQGAAKRRRSSLQPSLAKEFVMAKSIAPGGRDEDEDEFTALYDAQVPRIDLVGKGANGMPFLIAKSAGGAGGLFDADYVRALIAKSEPTQTQEAITVSGSPAAIAALIHGAPVRKAEPPAPDPDEVAKAEASTAAMNDRPDSDFAYIESGGTKDESGKTTPRSLRHFPIYDAAHVRDALSRAPQSPFGDKAMPKIRAAAKKFDIDVSKEIDMAVVTGETDQGIDGMDPTVVLAEPEQEQPGDPMEPGSPAWEAVDAATARKWTAIAVRIKNALGVMADRELIEAATADPDDAESAWDLQDMQCALDYVIDGLAGFAVGEQAEADLGGEAMDMVGKALAGFDPAALDTIECLAPVRKAGRVLSSANEAAIRGAVESLQKVLASLPAAPADEGDGAVAKTANEESDMPEPTPSSETTEASGQAPAMGAKDPEPKAVAGVAKAKGDPQVAVYDEAGNLVGTVDPSDITMLAAAQAPAAPDDKPAPQDAPPAVAAADAAPTDLTPAPAAEVGTPADAVPAADDDGIAKNTSEALGKSTFEGLLKAALQDWSASQAEVLKAALDERDQARGVEIEDLKKSTAEQTGQLETLRQAKAEQDELIAKQAVQITALENAPAVREVVRNGALPPEHLLRGQQNGAAVVDVAKAAEQRRALYTAPTAAEQNRIAGEMNAQAIAALQAVHSAR